MLGIFILSQIFVSLSSQGSAPLVEQPAQDVSFLISNNSLDLKVAYIGWEGGAFLSFPDKKKFTLKKTAGISASSKLLIFFRQPSDSFLQLTLPPKNDVIELSQYIRQIQSPEKAQEIWLWGETPRDPCRPEPGYFAQIEIRQKDRRQRSRIQRVSGAFIIQLHFPDQPLEFIYSDVTTAKINVRLKGKERSLTPLTKVEFKSLEVRPQDCPV